MGLSDLLLAGFERNLSASEREALRFALRQLEMTTGRMTANARAGATRSETIRRLVVDGDLDVPTGTVTIGPVASGKGNIKLNSGGIQLRTNTTVKIDLQTDGDVFIGENTAAAATTNIAIFTAAQTYNSESMSAGDMLIGDNSSGKANILWDKSAGQLLFRGGTTAQAWVDTDGGITAGGGDVVIDSSGISIIGNGTSAPDANRLKLYATDGTTLIGSAYIIDSGTPAFLQTFRLDFRTGSTTYIEMSDGTADGRIILEPAIGTDYVDLPTTGWIGLSSSAGRIVFKDATTDTVVVTDADLHAQKFVPTNSGGVYGYFKSRSGTLADDASVTLTGEDGMFLLRETTGNTQALIVAGYSGTPSVGLNNLTVNTSDTDGNWCFFNSGGDYVLKNRTGGSRGYVLLTWNTN